MALKRECLGYHLRAKRNWPLDSSRANAQIVNNYYQGKPDDDFITRYVQKPFARYVGRALGDEFSAVRDSIIDYQNRGYDFSDAHRLDTGYNPVNWMQYNWNNDQDEANDPYDPFGNE